MAICPLCGYHGYYEIGQVRAEHSNWHYFVLIQQDTDKNLVGRCFEVRHTWRKGLESNIDINEVERYVFAPGHMTKLSQEWDYRFHDRIWREYKAGRMTFTQEACLYEAGYGFDLWEEIRTSTLPYYDPNLFFEAFSQYGYEGHYSYQFLKGLALFSNAPWTESFAKMGWFDVIRGVMDKDGSTKLINKKGKTLKTQLRLKNGENVRIFQERMNTKPDKWYRLLEILQMAEKRKARYTEEEMDFLNSVYQLRDVDTMLKYMSLKQLMNRIKEYKKQKQEEDHRVFSDYQIFTEYKDYIILRSELGYDMTNEVYVHPKRLFEKHQECITEQKLRRDSERAKSMEEKYSAMQEIFEKLCKKYGWEEEGFIIRPAKCPTELIKESQALHHCVGSSDTYMKKHAEGKSFILFLRRKETPEVPFTTIEISGVKEKEARILQWYEAYDKKPDEEILQPIIDRYIDHLNKGIKNKPGKRARAS